MSIPRRRRPPEHRVRRARMPREGMVLQVDGSHHAWLEGRGPRFTLLLAVDDATRDAPYALFRPAEDARGYFSLVEQVVWRRGLPLALYTDRHGVFQAPPGRAGRRPPTQLARALGNWGSPRSWRVRRRPRDARNASPARDRVASRRRCADCRGPGRAQRLLAALERPLLAPVGAVRAGLPSARAGARPGCRPRLPPLPHRRSQPAPGLNEGQYGQVPPAHATTLVGARADQ